MNESYEFEVWEGDEHFTTVSAFTRADAWREAMNYASQAHEPFRIYEVKRTLVLEQKTEA